jgi:ankyrin repeat protein
MKVQVRGSWASDAMAACFREVNLLAVVLIAVVVGTAPAAWAQKQGAEGDALPHVEVAKSARNSLALCSQIHDAAWKGDLEKAKALLNDNPSLISCSSNDWKQLKPIHSAVLGGHKEVVEFLLAKKANVNERTKYGATPLHMASNGADDGHVVNSAGNKDMAELLLKHGADINGITDPVSDDGSTPLHWAAYAGDKEMVKFLLLNKANVNAKNGQGQTPLISGLKYKEVVEVLLAAKAKVNVRDYIFGNTELHWAALWGCSDAAELLLQSGLDVNAKNRDGQTPLDLAEDSNKGDVVSILRRHGGKDLISGEQTAPAVRAQKYAQALPLTLKTPDSHGDAKGAVDALRQGDTQYMDYGISPNTSTELRINGLSIGVVNRLEEFGWVYHDGAIVPVAASGASRNDVTRTLLAGVSNTIQNRCPIVEHGRYKILVMPRSDGSIFFDSRQRPLGSIPTIVFLLDSQTKQVLWHTDAAVGLGDSLDAASKSAVRSIAKQLEALFGNPSGHKSTIPATSQTKDAR